MPSERTRPLSLAAAQDPASTSSAQSIVSARMKPRSKSVWITPAAWGAVDPARNVQALVSFSPVVRNVRRPMSV